MTTATALAALRAGTAPRITGTCEDQDGYFDSRPACSKCGRFVAYRDVEVVAYHPASGWNGEVIDGHSSHPVCGSGVPVNDVFRWVGWTDPT